MQIYIRKKIKLIVCNLKILLLININMVYKCIICLDSDNDDYYILSCKHKFHYKCIYDWCIKYRNRYCPICMEKQSPIRIKKKSKRTTILKKRKREKIFKN